jgi:selenocysteine lyase/cysteine desulfurase
VADRVPAEPFGTFSERFISVARAGVHDLIYLSEVFYDSGLVVDHLDRIVSSVPEDRAFFVIDGYHAFMARPVDLGAIQDRVFYLAGGYKYAMAGEGVCFVHAPPGYGARPVDTGWYAGFAELETGVSELIPYPGDGGRFYGATFDPSGVYRLRAVLSWVEEIGLTPADITAHAGKLKQRLVASGALPGHLVVSPEWATGNFLTVENPDAASIYGALHRHNVIVDHRGDRLRIGLGIYQDEDDVDRLVSILEEMGGSRS